MLRFFGLITDLAHCLKIQTLRSCFIPQHSRDSPFRVFPFIEGRLFLQTDSFSHYVSSETV